MTLPEQRARTLTGRLLGGGLARKAVGVAGVAVGLALVAFALPIVRAEYARLFVSGLEADLRRQTDLSDERLADLAGVLRDARSHRRDPAIAQELGLIELIRLERSAASDDPAAYDRPAELLEEGLARRPAAPHAWTRLARARYQGNRPASAVREVLVLAITTGPTVRRLGVPRLEIGLRIWDALGDYERGLVRRQARLAFDHDARSAVEVALAAGRPGIVRGALRGLAGPAKFDRLLAEIRS